MTIKVGIIGVGGIAQHHIKALTKFKNVRIAGIYDINLERTKEIAQQVGADVFQNAHHLIDKKQIDALLVCSPPFARDDFEEMAAQQKIHLFVEKPLGLELQEVNRKEKILRESGIIHSSGYCLRYFDTVIRAKQYLEGKQIDLISACRFNGYYSPKWWSQLDKSGGQFVDQTSHQVDLIRFLVGEFSEVSAKFEQRSIHAEDPEATIYDVGTVSFVLDTGAIGNISNTCISPWYTRAEVEFYGRNFCVQLSENGKRLTIIDDEQHKTELSRVDVYYEQVKCFIEAITSDLQERVLCSYSDAMQTLKVALAANQSASENKNIKLV